MLYDDINSYQNISYITKLTNNEKQIFDNPIKVLKPAVFPVSFDTQKEVYQENNFNDIIYKNNDISTNYIQTENKINNANNNNKIVLPKKIFFAKNNNKNLSEDYTNYKIDAHNSSIKYNNKNTISYITNVKKKIENNEYSIPTVTNIEANIENNNYKYPIPNIEDNNNKLSTQYLTNIEENTYTMSYLTNVEENNNKYTIPSETNIEEENNYKYNIPQISNIDENNNKYIDQQIANIEENSNNKYIIPYITNVEENGAKYQIPYTTNIEENNNKYTIPYITNIEDNNNKYGEENNDKNYSNSYIKIIEDDNNKFSTPSITKLEKKNDNLKLNNNMELNKKKDNIEYAKTTKLATEIIKLTNKNEIYINKNNNITIGTTSSNQPDININGKNINTSNSLDTNNKIELTNLEYINELNNINSQNKQLLDKQKILIPEKKDQFRIIIEDENNENNDKNNNIDNINIINNDTNQYINNDNENNKNTNNTPDIQNENNNMLNIQNISDPNNHNNQVNKVNYIPQIESLQENYMGPKDGTRKKNNNLNNKNDSNLSSNENKNVIQSDDDVKIIYNNKLNRKNKSPLRKIPLDDYKSLSKTPDNKSSKKIKLLKNSSSDPYFNINLENNNYGFETNLTYNDINKSPKSNVRVIKLINNSKINKGKRSNSNSFMPVKKVNKKVNFNYKSPYNNNINDNSGRVIPLYIKRDNLYGKYTNNNLQQNNSNYLNNYNNYKPAKKIIVKELNKKDENNLNIKKQHIDYDRPILSEKDFYKNLKNKNIYQDNNIYSDSDELDNYLKKKSLKIEDFNFDDSISNLNKELNEKTNKKNIILDKCDNSFNNHEKFYDEMNNLLDNIK